MPFLYIFYFESLLLKGFSIIYKMYNKNIMYSIFLNQVHLYLGPIIIFSYNNRKSTFLLNTINYNCNFNK